MDRFYEGQYFVLYRQGYGFFTALRDWHKDILFARRFDEIGRAIEQRGKLFLGGPSPVQVVSVEYKMELDNANN